MHDALSSRALEAEPTGNGLRPLDLPSLADVSIRARSLHVAPGRDSLEDLVGGSRRAILVKDYLMGSMTSDLVTGGFSFVAPMAFLVEDGAISHPLPHTTVAGNVFTAMRDVIGITRDQKPLADGTYAGLAVKDLTCAC